MSRVLLKCNSTHHIHTMVLADLGKRINSAVQGLTSSGTLDDKAVDQMLKEICSALLEADVNVRLVSDLRTRIRTKIAVALDDKTLDQQQLSASQSYKKRLIQKSVFDELCNLVSAGEPFKPRKGRPNVIMFVGLQGHGKTTTCTKLASYYQKRGFRTGLVCADTFRAGAFDQLKQNATKAHIPFFGSYTEPDPVVVAREGVEKFKREKFEVILVDTSGRHRQESELFVEMQQISAAVKPDQTIMVLDASIGQAAKSHTDAFKESADFGSIIITKMDGEAKGGGALSAVASAKTPIAFIGVGEHMNDLEVFSPKSFIGKLLGIGDIQGLMEHVSSLKLDNKATIKHIQQGIFTLRDLRDQMSNIMKMGPLSKVASMIPGMGQFADQIGDQDSSQKIRHMICIMDSMTEKELDSDGSMFRENPSRIVRVARGSGTSVRDVEEVLTQQNMMASMAKKMGGKNGMMQRMKQAGGGRGGGLPGMGGMGGMPGMPGMPNLGNMNMGDMMKMVQNNPNLQNMMKQFGMK